MAEKNPFVSFAEEYNAFLKTVEDENGNWTMTSSQSREWMPGGSKYPNFQIGAYDPADIAEWWLDPETFFLFGEGVSSTMRAQVMDYLHNAGDYDWMKLVQANWSSLDDFHEFTDRFSEYFYWHYKESPAGEIDRWIIEDDKKWWSGLPEKFTVYRGCEKDRINGLSWTTDKKVASSFAKGHRMMRLNDPVIASIKITKADVYFATNDREEKEIVWDPTAKIQDIKVSAYP